VRSTTNPHTIDPNLITKTSGPERSPMDSGDAGAVRVASWRTRTSASGSGGAEDSSRKNRNCPGRPALTAP